MWHLMKSELIRFRSLALGFAIFHFLALRALALFANVFLPSLARILPGLLLYSLCGLILGLYQLGSYRKINQWTHLIHRPLPPWRIFVALGGAATLQLAVVIALPWLLNAALTDGASGQTVDVRHYLMGLYLFGLALSFYLVGCYVALSKSRAALLALALPMFFISWHTVGPWVFAVQWLVIAFLGYLAYSTFKPDLSTHLSKPLPLAASAIAFEIIFLLILAGAGGMAYQTGLITHLHGPKGFAVHAWNDYFPPGTFEHALYLTAHPEKLLAHGLAELDSERGRFLRRQLQLAETTSVPLDLKRYPQPVRHQLLFADRHLVLNDAENEIRWTFNHDRMLFEGQDDSGRPAGWLGSDGPVAAERFVEVPQVFDERLLVAGREIYEHSPKERELRLRFELPVGERLLSPLARKGALSTVVSSRALYFLEPDAVEDPLSHLHPAAVVPLPGEARTLQGVGIAELIDGYLVTFLFGRVDSVGYARSRQVVVELGVGGEQETVAERELTAGLPELYRYRAYIASPLVQHLYDLLWAAAAPRRSDRVGLAEIVSRSIPAPVLMAAIGIALLSAALTGWIARRRRLTATACRAWTVAVFLTGLPGLLSFLFLTPRRERMLEVATGGLALARPLEEGA